MNPRPIPAAPALSPGRGAGSTHELRCECGSLLARIERGEIELKCRRCKRVIVMRPGALRDEVLGTAARCVCSQG